LGKKGAKIAIERGGGATFQEESAANISKIGLEKVKGSLSKV
jgi:hypothetical protein